jgi:hypothetical protein
MRAILIDTDKDLSNSWFDSCSRREVVVLWCTQAKEDDGARGSLLLFKFMMRMMVFGFQETQSRYLRARDGLFSKRNLPKSTA